MINVFKAYQLSLSLITGKFYGDSSYIIFYTLTTFCTHTSSHNFTIPKIKNKTKPITIPV